jgi:hypothetical protein
MGWVGMLYVFHLPCGVTGYLPGDPEVVKFLKTDLNRSKAFKRARLISFLSPGVSRRSFSPPSRPRSDGGGTNNNCLHIGPQYTLFGSGSGGQDEVGISEEPLSTGREASSASSA